MIDRLIELRDVVPEGGNTAVVIRLSGDMYERALADVMSVVIRSADEHGPSTWENMDNGNTHKVIRVF
jgi:hypothetical protein